MEVIADSGKMLSHTVIKGKGKRSGLRTLGYLGEKMLNDLAQGCAVKRPEKQNIVNNPTEPVSVG